MIFDGEVQGVVEWELTGRHNVNNALATLAAARHVGVLPKQGAEALSEFRSVKRRMEKVAEVNGVTIYDDFAHHPTAIATTLDGLRKRVGDTPIIAVVEPRSNSMKLGAHREAWPSRWRWPIRRSGTHRPTSAGISPRPSPARRCRPRSAIRLRAIIAKVKADAVPGTQVVVMSNGGFGGLHGQWLPHWRRVEIAAGISMRMASGAN